MAASNPLSHVVQHPIGDGVEIGGQHFTVMSDQISQIIIAGFLLMLFIPRAVGRRKGSGIDALVPTGFGNGIEAICVYFRNEIAKPNLGEHTDRFIKYIWSVFFFILSLNLLGLLPIPAISSLIPGAPHLGGTATANIWTTATMAVLTLMMMVFNGLRLAPRDFIGHLCPGPLWLAPLLVPLELIGFLAKTFALSVRLFANMLAGHILLAVLVGFIISAGTASVGMGFAIAVPVVAGSVAITFLELLVAFVQAFIFTFLTTMFIGQSVVFHHHDDGAHGEAHA